MKSHQYLKGNDSESNKRQTRGFALVVTLSLMILLTLVAVGLLGLSSMSMRTGTQAKAESDARANARMALMLAIGELQKQTGSDTRITASAKILDPGAPPLTGVWKSWEGTNHETSVDPANYLAGRPIIPDYTVKSKAQSNNGRFLTWLVAGAKPNLAPTASLTDLTAPANSNDKIFSQAPFSVSKVVGGKTLTINSAPLLAKGTLDGNPGQVHLQPQLVQNTGTFTWWVSGENQKARLTQPYSPRTTDVAGLAEMGQSHTVTNPAVFGLSSLIDDPEPYQPDTAVTKPGRKAISRQTMALVQAGNPIKPQAKFHDLTSHSTGLLTNTATGGWRKDLSLLTEKWDAIYTSYPGGQLPLFRVMPAAGSTSTTKVPRPTTSAYDLPQSNFYPWSGYSLILGYRQPATYHAASASWASLQSFATSYKNFSYSSGVVKSPVVWDKIAKQSASSITSDEIYNHKHKQRLHPQIARFQFLVYARAIEDPARLNQDPKRYQLQLSYVPFFTLWNPYNITLEHQISGTLNGSQGSGTHQNFIGIGIKRSLPGALAIADQAVFPNPDSVPSTQYRLLSNGNFQTLDWPSNFANPYDNELNVAKFGTISTWRDLRTWACWLPEGTLTYKPGEAKMFSPELIDNGYGFGGGVFRMKEGYNPSSIVGRDFNASGYGNLLGSRRFWFLFRNDRLTQPYRDRAPGYGISLSFGQGSSHFGGTAVHPSGTADEFHNITALATESEGDKYWPPADVDEVPYSVAELASGAWVPLFSMGFGPRMTLGAAPGTKQNRPTKGTVQNDALVSMVLSEPNSGKAKDHPANNTFDFAYHSLTIGDTITPNLTSSKSFIATGQQSGDGLSRLIMCEIPVRPMASLVELQGWKPRGHNPYPPFQMNLIGNSDATPLIPKDKIAPSVLSPSSVQTNLQHDDAYCSNHLLFDDWFFSSIAPEPSLGATTSKDINTVYKEYLKGSRALTNRAYRPIAADSSVTDSVATSRITEIINDKYGWLKVASRFEVEGMFNVNSTSVEAWKALLGRARSLDSIAMHGANGIVAKDTAGKHVITRGAVATDVEAGPDTGFGAQFPNASEYTGFRNLSDDQIQNLADKVVAQVRLRGPFLSLSEFVNRQLSNDKDLALAGAIQTALNAMTADPMAKLRDKANKLSDTTMPPTDTKLGGVGYEFSDAAEGASAYGAPGWIRQADILRPIAPILSVRDDTFTIRAYGESLDQNGKTMAKAWCEAVVKRTRDFSNDVDVPDSIEPPANATNTIFGRRYEIVSFRWLNSNEV